MKSIFQFILVISLFTMTNCRETPELKYPGTRKENVVDDYFGTKVSDPYRWLENDTSAETEAWVKAQNQVTSSWLSQVPYRDKIRERLTKMWDFPRYGVPFREGDHYFFFRNDGLQNQSVLYYRKGMNGKPAILLDPNRLSEDGTVALSDISVSHDGKYLAYSVAKSGSDWNSIRIMEIETKKDFPETLEWVKFSEMSWQGTGFYYSRYDAPGKGGELSGKNENHKVYYHQVGTDQSQDRLVHADPQHPLRNFSAAATRDEKFLVLYASESTSGNAMYYKEAGKPDKAFTRLTDGFDHEYEVIDHLEGKFLVMTNHEAPKKRVVLLDPSRPEPKHWKVIIPEQEEVLESVVSAGGILVGVYMHNATSIARLYDYSGKSLGDMDVPGIGTLSDFQGRKEDSVAFFGFSSFTYPTTIYKYSISRNRSLVYHSPDLDFNPQQYEVRQIFYPSKDGTRIPMFIVMKKGLPMDGSNPLLLYGYGGFNVSLMPSFSISRLLFLENGGIYVMANLRGGGEFGEDWHKAGTKEKKQNVFDDFIAAAEYLIAEGYTSSPKLAIMGGSNGGLLVGACMTQRPELFKVAIPQVGVLDMLRYHKFTIGWAWASDYGTSETREGFDYLFRYSPLHNIREGVNYPATFAMTADHDDRVVPAHTFKFIATLQERHKGENPVLVRIEEKAGHGSGKPTSKLIDETTDLWSFVFFNLQMDFRD